jgi:hypothetical protein
MQYGHRRTKDSIPRAIPLLLATGSLGLLAIVWRRMAAPRRVGSVRDDAAAATSSATEIAPAAVAPVHSDQQTVHAGTGTLFHRQYDVVLTGTAHSSRELLRLLQQHLAELAPSMLAHFEKTAGSDGLLRVGDEYEITMLGPWNGAVRVSESTADSFTLVTLDGHPEAGHITFSVSEHGSGPDAKRVRIESWARARDAVVAAAYDTIGIGKQVQTEMWITFLQRLSALAGVGGTPEVVIATEELTVPDAPAVREAHG